jgi:ABC-type dipeptide/oligopeptide/nickel transport system permease subunit
MEFDLATTVGIFLAIVVVAVGGLAASGVMQRSTVLMMVLPSVLVFGAVCLFLGTKHGEYRTMR